MDSHGNPISLARWVRPPTSLLSTSFLQEADFESLTAINQYQAEAGTSQPGGKTGLMPAFWAGWQFVGKDLAFIDWYSFGRQQKNPMPFPKYILLILTFPPQKSVLWCAWISGKRATSACCSCLRGCAVLCAMHYVMLSWNSVSFPIHCV